MLLCQSELPAGGPRLTTWEMQGSRYTGSSMRPFASKGSASGAASGGRRPNTSECCIMPACCSRSDTGVPSALTSPTTGPRYSWPSRMMPAHRPPSLRLGRQEEL